jgi:hypothetical protein
LWKEIKLPCANQCHLFLLWIGMLKVFHGAYCHYANRMGVWSISHDNFIKYIEILVSFFGMQMAYFGQMWYKLKNTR